jgi:hypothetical protein
MVVLTSQVTFAEEFPKECFSNKRSCFHVLLRSNDLLAFHLVKNKVFHQKRNVSNFKINGQIVNQSHSKITSKPLKWTFTNRTISLKSDYALIQINFQKNSTIYLNGKALGQLTSDYNTLEQSINLRLSEIKRENEKRKKEAEIARKINLLSKSFKERNYEQRNQIQSTLIELGYYRSTIDGLWGQGTVSAVKTFIEKYDAGPKLTLPNNLSEANNVLNNIISYKADRERYLIVVEEKKKELKIKQEIDTAKRKEQRKLAAKRKRERLAREAKELAKFCEDSSRDDYWKRLDFLVNKPTNLLGVDMSMSKAEIEKVLSCKNYRCQVSTNVWGVSNTVCKNGKSEVTISQKQLSFNCASVNVCGLAADEVAQALVNAGKAFYMEPSVDYFEDIQILKYCDRGKAGDILCVTENELTKFFGGGASITIEKGNLGKVKPNFD